VTLTSDPLETIEPCICAGFERGRSLVSSVKRRVTLGGSTGVNKGGSLVCVYIDTHE
jgi:hypothetical protein